MQYQTVLDFWFSELGEEGRFNGGAAIDQLIRERFSDLHRAVSANECSAWRATPEGALAEVIVLDQFSRNLYRGEARAFAYDGQALALAQVAIQQDFDAALPPAQRLFLYMPFMHSESKQVHEVALQLFAALGNESSLKYEKIHKGIIDQFGRYPHRNQQLGRDNTEAETEYLKETNHSFFAS